MCNMHKYVYTTREASLYVYVCERCTCCNPYQSIHFDPYIYFSKAITIDARKSASHGRGALAL